VAIVQPGRRRGAEQALIAEFEKLKREPVTATELQRAKNQFARDYIVGRESNQDKALHLAHAAVIHNDISTADGEFDIFTASAPPTCSAWRAPTSTRPTGRSSTFCRKPAGRGELVDAYLATWRRALPVGGMLVASVADRARPISIRAGRPSARRCRCRRGR
jgi:hypothetical protein